MNLCQADRGSMFRLEGEFVSLIGKPGKNLKYLCMTVGDSASATPCSSSQLHIRLAKPLRKRLNPTFVKGDRLQVLVGNKSKKNSGKLKLKAYQIEPLSCQFTCVEDFKRSQTFPQPSTVSVGAQYPPSKSGKILVCQKSGCLKRGGKKFYHALQDTIRDLGLEGRVKIEGTGCQKRCKKAPNMVLMPGKAKYSQIEKKSISVLLEEHYLTAIAPSESSPYQN